MKIEQISYKIELSSEELHRIGLDLTYAFQYRLSMDDNPTNWQYLERQTLSILKTISESSNVNYERMALDSVDSIIQNKLKEQSKDKGEEFPSWLYEY